jgi:3-dehydroquinate synthase
LIYDADLFAKIKSVKPSGISPEFIYRSVEIKNEVVKADPFEKGLRKILNFGHTIGHALESYSLQHDKKPLLHGEAIAIGFICEAYLSAKKNKLSKEELREIIEAIRAVFPAYKVAKSSYSDLLELMKNDKKNTGGKISFSLLSKIGACDFDNHCTEEEILESLDFYSNFKN